MQILQNLEVINVEQDSFRDKVTGKEVTYKKGQFLVEDENGAFETWDLGISMEFDISNLKKGDKLRGILRVKKKEKLFSFRLVDIA